MGEGGSVLVSVSLGFMPCCFTISMATEWKFLRIQECYLTVQLMVMVSTHLLDFMICLEGVFDVEFISKIVYNISVT